MQSQQPTQRTQFLLQSNFSVADSADKRENDANTELAQAKQSVVAAEAAARRA